MKPERRNLLFLIWLRLSGFIVWDSLEKEIDMAILIAANALGKFANPAPTLLKFTTTVTKGAALVRFQAAQRAKAAFARHDAVTCADKALELPV